MEYITLTSLSESVTIARLSEVSTTPFKEVDQDLTPYGDVNSKSPTFELTFSVNTFSGNFTFSTLSVIFGSDILYSFLISSLRVEAIERAREESFTTIVASAEEGITFLLVPPFREAIVKDGNLFR